MTERFIPLSQFTKATGRSVAYVREKISNGDLPSKPDRPLYRNENGEMCFAHTIPVSQIARYRVPHGDAHSSEDPAIRRDETMHEMYEKRDRKLALEAGDPETVKSEALETVKTLTEQQKAALRRYYDLPEEG
jgi:hypothetical protein